MTKCTMNDYMNGVSWVPRMPMNKFAYRREGFKKAQKFVPYKGKERGKQYA